VGKCFIPAPQILFVALLNAPIQYGENTEEPALNTFVKYVETNLKRGHIAQMPNTALKNVGLIATPQILKSAFGAIQNLLHLIELRSFVLSCVQINTDLNTILATNRVIGKVEQVLITSEENLEPALSIGERQFITETIIRVKNADIRENFCKHTTLNHLQTTPIRDLILITALQSVYLVMKKFMGKRLIPLASSLKTVLNAASPYREKDIIAGLVEL